jgi:hypothetical protein
VRVIFGNGFLRLLPDIFRAGLATVLIASPSLARAQSVITSETTRVTLAAAPQPDGRLALTATVTGAQGSGVPGGTLKFIDESNGGLLGLADVATPSIVIDRLAPGAHRIRADYSGTADFLPLMVQPSGSAVVVHHELTRPAVTVLSSGNPSLPGEVVTLTAVVSGRDAAPKGNVTFRDGSRVLAAHVGLDRGGIASFTTSALADGPRAVTAEYEGDGAYAPTISPRLMQEVAAIDMLRAQRDR